MPEHHFTLPFDATYDASEEELLRGFEQQFEAIFNARKEEQ